MKKILSLFALFCIISVSTPAMAASAGGKSSRPVLKVNHPHEHNSCVSKSMSTRSHAMPRNYSVYRAEPYRRSMTPPPRHHIAPQPRLSLFWRGYSVEDLIFGGGPHSIAAEALRLATAIKSGQNQERELLDYLNSHCKVSGGQLFCI